MKRKSSVILYLVLIIMLVGALYFRCNTGKVYSSLGEFYFLHNNIELAQKFCEKSFHLGNTDSSVRDIYVNSIITSPLTLSSQEKLVKLAEDDIQDQASYKAKVFLNDLKREIHKKYADNYIKQAPFNQKIVRWNRFPITYNFRNVTSAPTSYVEEIRNAFLEWEKVGLLMFSEINEGADIQITFAMPQHYNSIESGAKYVVAYTVPSVTGSTLERMDMKFYLKDPDGNFFSNNQIYNTALHEIFHALGFMGHSFNPENIMYLSKGEEALYNDKRANLTDADIETQKLLYKIKPDITNADELDSEYVPYLLLGDIQELTSNKTREAVNYIRKAPTLPTGYIDLAENYVAQKRYPEAIKVLESAYQLADSEEIKYIIYYNLAISYLYIDHLEMALEYADKAMDIKNNTDVHFLKAEIYAKNNSDLAEEEYCYLVNNAPNEPEYVIRLANLYVKHKAYLKARKVLKSFIKNNPKYKGDERFAPYKILLF